MPKVERLTRLEMMSRLPKLLLDKKCLHPNAPHECRGKIVKAHTVQKRFLLAISGKRNQVLSPQVVGRDFPPRAAMRKLGYRKASTYRTYCAYHDNMLFAPIEKRPMELTAHHAFLLAFRSISREMTRNPQSASLTTMSDGCSMVVIEDPQQKDLFMQDQNIFAEMCEGWRSQCFQETRFYAIVMDNLPDILCSGTTNVEFDFAGNRLQDAFQPFRQDIISLSVLPYQETMGVALFSWYGNSEVNQQLIESLSLLSHKELPNALVRFMFQHFENFFVAPRWWNNLPELQQQLLLKRFLSTFSLESISLIDLRSDGIQYVDWNVLDIQTNLPL